MRYGDERTYVGDYDTLLNGGCVMRQAATKAKGKGGKDLRKALAVLLAGDGDGEDEVRIRQSAYFD